MNTQPPYPFSCVLAFPAHGTYETSTPIRSRSSPVARIASYLARCEHQAVGLVWQLADDPPAKDHCQGQK